MKQIKYSAIASALLLAGISTSYAAEPISLTSSGDDGNAASNTTDSDLTTRWSANGNDGSQWVQYDFGSDVPLSGVSIAFYKGDSRSTYFRIESSNDASSWSTEVDSVSSGDTADQEDFAFSETVTARYIRYVGFGNSSNTWNSVTEVDFTDGDENVVVDPDPVDPDPVEPDPVVPVDAAALASSDDGNVADNVIDSSLDTRWSANGSGEWVRLDLGSEQTLDNVQLAFYKGSSRQSIFSIEVSDDDSSWTTVLDETYSSGSSLALETFTFNAVNAQYIRYTGYGNTSNTWNSVTEFTVSESTDPGGVVCEEGSSLVDGVCVEDEEEVTPITCDDGYSLVGDECVEDEVVVIPPVTDPVDGQTYYTSADDLNEVLASAVGGDEIIITDSGEISIKDISFDSQVLIRAETVGGLKLENATIQNSNNITLQGFMFGPSNDVSTLVKIVNSTNIKVLRNYFDHLDVTEGQSSLVVTESSQFIEIGYNEFHDKNISVVDGAKNTGSYIKFQYDVDDTTGEELMTKDAHIHHNYFNNITPYLVDGTPAGDSDREAIVMGISSSQDIETNHIVEYNLFENCDGENEILTIKTSENTFRYNTFKNSMGSLSFRLGYNNSAYGNYFYGTGASDSVEDDNYQTGGIRIYGEGHSVYDNYMEGLSGTSWRLPLLIDNGDTSDSSNGDSHETPTNINVANNTIVDSTGGGIYIGREDSSYKNSPSNITVTGNVVIGSEGTLFGNDADDSSNTWSGNTAYNSGSATVNSGGILDTSELVELTSSPSVSKPTMLTESDVGINAN
ncbi:hypothetical protein A9264_03375 [Vibrio sp. UCD-FRSSP16_10]|uniref:discoidin domain-containing protein n=1 Tax=unclassified Vibrio TaxID=2614977 RepID=UPI000801C1E8|nr:MULTISPECIES: discoidin domain-containing protein [unclassified Vibrio]OBT12189.1 hypothetical protein A9260_04825 [Vibrio sp. UCD-FRSSP16_30]OBT20520.1 hypothetical protein A9264_03375 [Vibrio sp. UCD-FRSSP16_10]